MKPNAENAVLRTEPREGIEPEKGSVLVVAVLAVAILALLLGSLLSTLLGRFNVTYQTAAWQEARLGAEAGVERAMYELNRKPSAPFQSSTGWAGWKVLSSGATDVSSLKTALSFDSATGTNSVVQGVMRSSSGTIIMDNFQPTGLSQDSRGVTEKGAVVDVELVALYPNPNIPTTAWYRVRSLATAGIQGNKRWTSPFREDMALRRLNVANFRFGAAQGDQGTSQASVVPLPSATRYVEAIIRPQFSFDKAIVTENWMKLGNSNNPFVDSYNSDDGFYRRTGDNKDANGENWGHNGSLASNGKITLANDGEIEPGKTKIWGDVQTHDDPIGAWDGTAANLPLGNEPSGGFEVELPPPTAPTGGVTPADATNIVGTGGTQYYQVTNLGPITVTGTGTVVIVVTGNWTTGNGNSSRVIVADTLTKVEVYVAGNVDFGNGDIGIRPDGLMGGRVNLFIYGTGASGTIAMNGNPNKSFALYAPTYDFSLKGGGNGVMYGSIVAKTVDLSGGGNWSFHYDEALANDGIIVGYKLHSFHENFRN